MKYFFKMKIIVFIFSIFFIFPNIAHAYLDPGTINVVFQVLAGFLGALLLFFNLVNKSIRYFLTKKIYSTILLVSIFIFPIWIFKSAFDIKSIALFLVIIYLIPLILIVFLLKNVEDYFFSKNFFFGIFLTTILKINPNINPNINPFFLIIIIVIY